MKITRETHGSGLKKRFSRNNSRVFGSISNASIVVWERSCQILSPVSVAVQFRDQSALAMADDDRNVL